MLSFTEMESFTHVQAERGEQPRAIRFVPGTGSHGADRAAALHGADLRYPDSVEPHEVVISTHQLSFPSPQPTTRSARGHAHDQAITVTPSTRTPMSSHVM